MKIKQKFQFAEGEIDLSKVEIVPVMKPKYSQVSLCFKCDNGFNIPFADIKLYDTDKYNDAIECFESAKLVAEKIAKCWNEKNQQMTKQ